MLTDPVNNASRERPLRACMLAYTFYENDGRVMRYAEALAQSGAEVDAIVLRRPGQALLGEINGVNVCRIQPREKNERGKITHLWRLVAFFTRSMREVNRRHRNKPYDIIHVHSVPDWEVFAAIVPKLKGARIVLDIHDIVPELYAAKFGVEPDSIVFKCLTAVERLSSGFADHVIAANDLWLERLVQRSVERQRCSVFINYPDLTVFRPALRSRVNDGRFVVLYPGTLNWHQGLDIAVKAVGLAKQRVPGLQLDIYGEGPAESALRALIEDLGLDQCVQMKAPMPLRDIAAVMANADLGVVPKRDGSFGGEAFSTKILEFMALGIPLVVADTRIDRHYFDDSLLRFFPAGDERALADMIVEAYEHQDEGHCRAAAALEYVAVNSWGHKKHAYLDLVHALVRGAPEI
jgi:glycosyltransferase involved in cell wall biosynthesis